MRRASRTSGVSVRTTKPSATGYTQEATMPSLPPLTTSTAQRRHAPYGGRDSM